MKIRSHKLWRHGNIHTRRLAMELRLEGAEGVFLTRKDIRRLPKMFDPPQGRVADCPAWRRLRGARQPVPAAAVVEVLSLITQRCAYWPVKFCAWRADAANPEAASPEAADPGDADAAPDTPAPSLQAQGRAVFEIGSERTGRAAAAVAVAVTTAMIKGVSRARLHDLFFRQLEDFIGSTGQQTPAADSLRLAALASKRSIPWSSLHESQYLQLGSGRYTHILKGSESTHTASVSRAISRDKRLTREMLAEADLPVARQRTARSEKTVVSQAQAIGYPLVVKPLDGNMGNGVTVGVADDEQLLRAFHHARKFSRTIVLEHLIEGDEYRLLVVDGRYVSAMHRSPAQVRGDGLSTVAALVALENTRPERASVERGRTSVMKAIQIDDEAIRVLSDQGLTPDSVPPEGVRVLLRQESNLSRGGEPFDVTDRVHPSIRDVAERAADVIGLDVCGVDFITTDVERPYTETGGAICELNSRPGVNPHLHVMGKEAHKVTDAMLEMLYPPGAPARIPIVVLLGSPSQTRAMRRDIEAVATRANRPLGAVLSRRNGKARPATLLSDTGGALGRDNRIEAGIIEITPTQVVRRGIGAEYVDLALLAPSDGSETHELAADTVTRIASSRVAALDDPAALARALEVLGLPTGDAVAFPTPFPEAREGAMTLASDRLTALFVGDVGFGESYAHRPRMEGLPEILATQGPGYSLAGLRGLLGMADLTIANLEVPLANTPDPALEGRKNYLGWCRAQPTLAALQEARIDAVTLANNHALDCGTSGLAETMMRLHGAGIAGFGAGGNADAAAEPFIHRFTVGGTERALVVFAGFERRARYQNEYHWYADDRLAGIGKLAEARIATQIAALRDTLPNPTFVVFPHWGVDYAGITGKQRKSAAALAHAGADLVIGHGAHVVQDAEMVGDCLVIYNIGNFVWNTPGRFSKRGAAPYGLAVALNFGEDPAEGLGLRLYPIVIDNAVTGFQNRPVTSEEFADALEKLPLGPHGLFHPAQDEVGFHLETTLSGRGAVAVNDVAVSFNHRAPSESMSGEVI